MIDKKGAPYLLYDAPFLLLRLGVKIKNVKVGN